MSTNFNILRCFTLVPDNTQRFFFELTELTSIKNYQPNSFVLLPYKNPQTKNTQPLFYKIINKTKIEIPEYKDSQKTILLKSKTTKENYIKKIIALKEHIQQGNIYEVNYCIEFFADDVEINPLEVFLKLNEISKAPYSSMVKLKDDFIISASPELFLKKEGAMLYTKPIKGTAKRGKTKEEDEILKTNLYNNLKERTENVMAVDVARNDLSILAKKGSVHVNKLYNIETYETVHQMVSTVSCELKENTSFEKIIEATFPMASMTGAPKLRAMQLINEYEDFDRSFYSGAMGVIDKNEDFTLAVNIRSIFYNQKTKRLSIAVGSAITYLCEPEKEYDECLLKANALLKALNARIE
ncbi:MAG: anthranilate synthase component I family protein [Bacteroidota bacterium]|nr:anthranilate synthase component I family protein [Bacteroidota bacterium]